MDNVLEKHSCFGCKREEDTDKGGECPLRVVAVQQLNKSEDIGEDVDGRQDGIEEDKEESFALTHHLPQLLVLFQPLEESRVLVAQSWDHFGATSATAPACRGATARHPFFSHCLLVARDWETASKSDVRTGFSLIFVGKNLLQDL